MRFYHLITLVLALVCLFGDGGQGAPATGRYMWLKCSPDDKSANCITQKGPVIPLIGQSPRLPPSAAADIVPVNQEETTPEMAEESGDGSAGLDNFPLFYSQRLARGAPEQDGFEIGEEGSTNDNQDIDYEYIPPQKIDQLSAEDLKEDNIIV